NQVSGLSTALAGITLPAHGDVVSLRNTGRHLNLYGFFAFVTAFAMTFRTLIGNNTAFTITIGTGMHIDHLAQHGFTYLADLSHPVTGAAGFKICLRFCTDAATGITLNLLFYLKFLFRPKSDLLETKF